MVDGTRIEGFLSVVSRLTSLPVFVVSASGRILVPTGVAEPAPDEEAALLGAASRLCSQRLGDVLQEDRLTALLVSSQGIEIGAVIAFGDAARGPTGLDAAQVVRAYIENLALSEHEIESLTGEILERYEEVNMIYELSEKLSALFDPQVIARIAAEKGARATKATRAAVLLDRPAALLTVAAAVGPDAGAITGGRIAALDPFVQSVYTSPQALLLSEIGDCRAPRVETAAGEEPLFVEGPLLAVPLRVGEATHGCIVVSGTEFGEVFGAGEVKTLVSIASQAAIAIQNSTLVDELRQSERVKREMEIAESIQARLLPDAPPACAGLDIASRVAHPAMVGGDYYDYLATGPEAVTFVIADVTGHSFGSALVMAIARSVLRGEAIKGSGPAEILANASRILYQDLTNSGLLITVFTAHWNGTTRRLTYANAGHCPALRWCARERRTESLDADGLVVGVLEETEFEQRQAPFESGDVLLLYTDGVTEARDENGKMFGDARLLQCFESAVGETATAEQVVEAITGAVNAFRGSRPISDDISLVVVRATA
jgi:sigma-B regulation protein RsbU (phosphoserine phosphatase)